MLVLCLGTKICIRGDDKMSVTVEINLWAKPNWMMNIEDKDRMNVKELKEMGDWFKEHLYNTAEIVDKLQKSKWKMCECCGPMYSAPFYKEGIDTKKEAKIELKKLRINPNEVSIFEFEDEEE